MKVLTFVMMTMVVMAVDVQSLGIAAQTACECMSQAYLKGKVTACKADGNFEATQFAEDIVRILPTCFNIPILLLTQLNQRVSDATANIRLPLILKAQTCHCAHQQYLYGFFESCTGSGNFEPFGLVLDVLKYMTKCQTGNW